MKTTDATITLPKEGYISQGGRLILEGFVLRFNLSKEDFELFANEILPTMPNCDMADGLLSMITYGIHKAMEELTGKPFILDMDRMKDKKA